MPPSSSSSRKKKRHKISSKGRAKKSGKTESRKRESKKLLRQISDDEDSRSSMSGLPSSSSAEDTKSRRKKSRVRIKKRVVSAKKKTRKRSYRSESSDDDDSTPVRKRSGSKRKRKREKKRKSSSKKKKRRRHDSVSSTDSSRKRGRDEREEENPDNVERETKRSRYRSASLSFSELSGSGEYQVDEIVSVENNPRRLKSVIFVVKRDEEDTDYDRDEHKEEIVYDRDDYPSCRSNDSDNGPHADLERKMKFEDEKDDDTVVSEFRSPEKDSDELGQANKVIELESVLRQRALDNLQKFRGRLKTSELSPRNQKSQNDGDTKPPSVVKNSEPFQIKSSVENDSKIDEMRTDGNSNRRDTVAKPKVEVGISKPKPRLIRTTLTRQSSKTDSTQIESRLDNNVDETAPSSVQNPDDGVEINEAQSSEVTEPSVSHPVEPEDEANEASQLEQKSMSVMRGGEMVQVKYKVYIPKKAPALTRRQLKR